VQAFFREHGYEHLGLWPMTRGRLVALNGKPVTLESFEDPDTRRWINREFNLSWTDRFGSDNTLLQGAWWDESARGKPWLSVDEYAQERLKLKVGDTLRLSIADREVELEVHNVRKVSWDSFRPNFFLVTPPGVLEDGPTQWITSFHLAPERRALLRELVSAFPNVTALDLDAAMAQVRGIIDRVVRAVEFIFLFTLAAGVTVLLAAIEGTRAERVRETALLRTLGASTRTITLGLLAEYAALGLVAGLIASAAAQAIGWVLAVHVFELEYRVSLVLWLAGSFGGAALVCVLGWWSLRRTLSTPPRTVLAVTG
jgi:putative ABC transport system permease protein